MSALPTIDPSTISPGSLKAISRKDYFDIKMQVVGHSLSTSIPRAWASQTSTAAKLHTIASALDVSAHGNKEAVAFELSMTWRHPAVAFELSMTWRRPGVPRANLSLES